ncbi:MAG TPA: hypothetical protein VN699_11960 [Pirellulales bacterium]|nr:hypothetical protein [Pirellulales bacterium]
MTKRIFGLAAACIMWDAGPVMAQQASTIQLPSFSYFSVDTTVAAPDRGSMSLGGSGSSSRGSTAFGPSFGPRSWTFGRQSSVSRATVHVRIYDFDAMDKQLLGQARKSYGSSKSARDADAPERSSAESAPPGSVAEARRLRGADAAADQKQVLDYLRQAERAKARGKLQVVKVLYQMAERRASGELKADVRRKLAALNRAPAAESVSKSK